MIFSIFFPKHRIPRKTSVRRSPKAGLSRRTFFKGVCAAIAALACPVVMKAGAKPALAAAEKEAIIAQALNTEAGRRALAQSMVEPIRRQLEYASVGRKILMVDELPVGALAKYENELSNTISQILNK